MEQKDLQIYFELISEIKKFPGISARNINRIVFYLLSKPVDQIEKFGKLIIDSKKQLRKCVGCLGFTENEMCTFCIDEKRTKNDLCIVSSWIELVSIREAAIDYKGNYFVLGGVLSPLDGVSVNDLAIGELIEKVVQEKVINLIFAFSSTPESEVTIDYIKGRFESINHLSVCFWRIASGIPVGGSLEFVDRSTILQAFSEKRQF